MNWRHCGLKDMDCAVLPQGLAKVTAFLHVSALQPEGKLFLLAVSHQRFQPPSISPGNTSKGDMPAPPRRRVPLAGFTSPGGCWRAGGRSGTGPGSKGRSREVRGATSQEPPSCPSAKTLPTAPPSHPRMDDATETGTTATKPSPDTKRPNPQYPAHTHCMPLLTTIVFYDTGVFCFWRRQSTVLNKARVFALTQKRSFLTFAGPAVLQDGVWGVSS